MSTEVLPYPWQEIWTDEGYAYYWNPDTDETTWEFPTSNASASATVSSPSSSSKLTKSNTFTSPSTSTSTPSSDSKKSLGFLGNIRNSLPISFSSATSSTPSTSSVLPPNFNEQYGCYSGYLTKKGIIRRNWKKRFFVLENGSMYYFASPQGYDNFKKSSGKPHGYFEVKNNTPCGPATALSGKYANCFQVVKPYRVYFMYADSADEMDRWKAKLEEAGAKWEGRLARVSQIEEDGTVSFNTPSTARPQSTPTRPTPAPKPIPSAPLPARPTPSTSPPTNSPPSTSTYSPSTTSTTYKSTNSGYEEPIRGPKDISAPVLVTKPNPITAKKRAPLEVSSPRAPPPVAPRPVPAAPSNATTNSNSGSSSCYNCGSTWTGLKKFCGECGTKLI